ncbi:putative pre-mRNA cleavage complex II Clp1 protein [Trypanosoma rangeli]|uniref:Putative pre-mRNA cleavage complex II Clp1 protein n=1 Tax=Trypanosoma rangeli TaxID=5698 RepID=A0A3R7KU37_TRYRA|nr:putative pre-mRNA cleavage complex II Clp1 protein [Trypanosoma rangeli]RNF09736.1 putative pre-mRNA cleavage complex II Clp1 protein [Trypanosoma rangeli]|eukprot:RNF09736.1 putative pre-mRNA cleavage complex II Clp1 protein [Trypanosoma rangeli]
MEQGIQHAHYELERSELNLHFTGSGCIVLVDGTASVYGAPLKRNVRYNFPRCGIPVASPLTCRLHVEGEFTATVDFLNSAVDDIHAVLDLARTEATMSNDASRDSHDEAPRGPRALIIGGQNTGKSSLCRALANLATCDKKYGVALVDADVGQQGIACPGSIATAFIENYIPVDDGFNTMMPLTFFFGDKIVNASSRKRYLDICAFAAQAIDSVCMSKPQYATGGVIVNTMGWTTGIGRDVLFELVSVFSITHVVVCGFEEDLAEEVRKTAVGRSITLLRYPKQPHIFERGPSELSESRTKQLVTYFKGTLRTPLSPYRGVAFVKDVQFVNALTLEVLSWQEVAPLSLVAVSWSDSLESVDEANIAGFIVPLEIGRKFFSFLSPASGSLPKPFLLVSPTIKLPSSKVPPFSAS